MRRKIRIILNILSGTAALMAAVACPNNEIDLYFGQQVSFSASTGYLNSQPDTRTSYSGLIFNGYERIDWETGDPIKIYSDQATNASDGTHFADYAVKSASGSSSNSNAVIAPVGGNGLIWGTGQHDFYTVYPAPSRNASVSLEKSGDDILIHGTVPAEQTVTWMTSGTTAIAKPNMDYAYMYAAVKNSTPSSTVNLYFKPMITAFQITVTSADDNVLTLKSFRMISDGDDSDTETPWCALSGDFTATITGATTAENLATDAATFACPARDKEGDDANNVITVDLQNQKVYKNASQGPTSAYFTVFALPQNLSHVRLELIVVNANNEELTRKIALKRNVTPGSDDSEVLTFPACHKAYINNLSIPGTWVYSIEDISNITVSGSNVLNEYSVTRNIEAKRVSTGMADQNVAWKAYFVDVSQVPAVNYIKKDSDDWSTTPLKDGDVQWLTLSQYEGDGYPVDIDFTTVARPLNDAEIEEGPAAKAMIEVLRANEYSTPLDLSTYDFVNKVAGQAPETANCYIVDGVGTFLIPLVYGNAIRNGAINDSAYIRRETSIGSRYNPMLSKLINGDNQYIQNPFIIDDYKLSHPTSDEFEGIVVWQDVQKTFEIIEDSQISIVPKNSAGTNVRDCDYLKFSVDNKHIKPGNVVIALRDKSTEQILWSWHIWVTSEPFRVVNVENYEKEVFPFLSVNLGHVPPVRFPTKYTDPERKQYVVFVSKADNLVLGRMLVTQGRGSLTGDTSNKVYSGTKYEWGRKDPFVGISDNIGGNGLKVVTSNHYSIGSKIGIAGPGSEMPAELNGNGRNEGAIDNSTVPSYIDRWRGRYAFEISHPHRYMSAQYGYQNRFNNLWNVNNCLTSTRPATKSIYDPSPRGFVVPRKFAFYGFATYEIEETTEYGAGQRYKPGRVSDNSYRGMPVSADETKELPKGTYFSTVYQDSYEYNADNSLFFPIERDIYNNTGNYWTSGEAYGLYWTADLPDDYFSVRIRSGTDRGLGNDYTVHGALFMFYNKATDPEVYIEAHASRASGFNVRPVVDILSSSTIGQNTGVSIAGQTVDNHNASGISWE